MVLLFRLAELSSNIPIQLEASFGGDVSLSM